MENSSLRALKIMPRNLKEIIFSWFRLLEPYFFELECTKLPYLWYVLHRILPMYSYLVAVIAEWVPASGTLDRRSQRSFTDVMKPEIANKNGLLTAKNQNQKLETDTPRNGIVRPQSRFPHSVSVSVLFIPTIDLPILLQEICGPLLGIFKSLTDTWRWKLGLRPCNSRKGIHKFSLQCLFVINRLLSTSRSMEITL